MTPEWAARVAILPGCASGRAVLSASVVTFVVALWVVRSQVTVGDSAWMKAMIPHHSIAVLTSERAHIVDSRVRRLAEGIIKTQREEIAEMKVLLGDLDRRLRRQGRLAIWMVAARSFAFSEDEQR